MDSVDPCAYLLNPKLAAETHAWILKWVRALCEGLSVWEGAGKGVYQVCRHSIVPSRLAHDRGV
jgi:hypothetical protein